MPGTNPCGTYEITYAREFRYDSGRQRYLNREMDAAEMNDNIYSPALNGDTWTDYDGDDPYGDYTMSGSTAVNARSFEPGMATVDPWAPSGSANTSYYHGNQIGSTRMMSDNTGAATGRAAYTAFGERISGTNHRYGYAGAYGYQQHSFDEVSQLDPPQEPDTVFPYMHVGARYYDLATGRFLQRDPIGIRGGLNVYGYVFNAPTGSVDPSGKGWWSGVWTAVKIVGGIVAGVVGGTLIGATSPGWVAVGIGLIVVGAVAEISAIIDIWPQAMRSVRPVRKAAKRRNNAVDCAIDDAGMGVGDDW